MYTFYIMYTCIHNGMRKNKIKNNNNNKKNSDAAEMSSWGQQREQSVGRVAGVFDNHPGFPCTPPGVDVLEGGKLTSNNVAGSSHDPLQSFAVASGAVSKPGGDAAGQDALHSAGVEGSEDAGARSKLPQPSQEEEVLMCLLQHCVCVSRPCEILGEVNAEELKAVYPLHRCLYPWWWVCVLCSVSWNPPPAPWSCQCWVRGGSPDTI